MKRALRHSVKNVSAIKAVKREKVRAAARFESLESRLFLSGSVIAFVAQGQLNIRGDSADNAIVMDQVGLTDAQVRITAADNTSINGQANPVVLSGVTRGVVIRLGRGADSLTLSGLVLPGVLSVNAQGSGSSVVLGNAQIAANLIIQNGASLSTTAITNTTIGNNLIILPGPGGQNIALRSIDVQRNTSITTGNGADALTIDDSTFHGSTVINTDDGADMVQLDSNGAPLGPPTLFDGPVFIWLGRDDDTLQLGVEGQSGNQSIFGGEEHFHGGQGFDTLLDFDASTYTGNSRYWVRNFESTTPAPDITAPTVTSTDPANGITGVALNKKTEVTFSEAMDPLTITAADLTVSAPDGTKVPGTVAYLGTTATFSPTNILVANTVYTETITTAAHDLAEIPLANDYVWSFTTGATADTTAPTVISTNPTNNETGVALNSAIEATFSEAMDPLTITSADVTVTSPGGVAVPGTVGYVGMAMTFTAASSLAPDTLFTATITTGAKDLAGNPLANNYVWSFRTGSTPDITAPTVTSTNPANLQTNVPINDTVAATFSKSMNPLTITAADFTVAGPGNAPVPGTVSYNIPSDIATFTPSSNLAASTKYTATINGGATGARDLSGNSLTSNKVWSFTTGTQVAQAPINLGSASTFAVMATSSITNSGPSVFNGDVGLNPGTSQGIPPAQVNGTIHIDDQAIIKAQSDLLAAYNDAVSRSVTPVSLPGNMGGLTFTPGLYTNSTSVLIQGAGPANNVTLDAQGNPNAIFIFQMGSTLTTGPGAQVILAGGAKASNVFWQVGSSATLNTTTIFQGSILAAVTITVNSGSVIDGRLLAGSDSAGSVTIDDSTVTVPST